MDDVTRGMAVAMLAVATGLAAAKAHGRQVRLLREAHGFRDVVFGRVNHPWVEDLWRRDRRTLWPALALTAVVLLGLAMVFGLPDPFWAAVATGVSTSLVAGFMAATIRWAAVLHKLLPGRWITATVAWWLVVAVGLGAQAALLRA